MNRRQFMSQSSVAAVGILLLPSLLLAQTETKKVEKPPQISANLVRDFVAAGHNNLAKVKEMLAGQPNLLFACHDWGGGDFETALEGAGHVGDAEIAEYLIGQGARPNIFVMSMLGNTEFVKAQIEKYPSLLRAKGPHGYTLLHHADRGGEPAAELVEYFTSKGLTEKKLAIYS